jgi:hypothetical protein
MKLIFFSISSFDIKLLALELCDFFTFLSIGLCYFKCGLVKLAQIDSGFQYLFIELFFFC